MAGGVLAAAFAWGVAAPGAGAFEYFDGRLQVHGYFEEQIRAMSDDFSFSDDLDLAQWYNVLSVEVEYDFAPDGFGPFDVLSGFMRVEGRYDCVWTRACGMFSSANAWGDRARHLPGVRTTGARPGYSGAAFLGDLISGPSNPRSDLGRYTASRPLAVLDRRCGSIDPNTGLCTGQPLTDPFIAEQVRENHRRPARIDQIPGFGGLFVVAGVNGLFEAGRDFPITAGNGETIQFRDDPAYFYFNEQYGCKFGVREYPGGDNGHGFQIIGPVDPDCEIDSTGALRDKPNPFNSADLNPILRFSAAGVDQFGVDGVPFTADDVLVNFLTDPTQGIEGFVGSAELPGRPASELMQGQNGSRRLSKGVYYPSPGFRNAMKNKDLNSPGQDFSQSELSWNHGDSQGWERELKEIYLDMEFFDSQLWIRAGRQSIVWGKTELFRTTDQANPVDLALASLPSLEESRVSVWSVRGVWSFYDIGPAEDVRLEVAFNFDKWKPNDTGRCGEPFTALVACNKTFALWLHGLTGFALAGEDRPDSPWQDIEGITGGARLEFRLGRFSVQVSDWWGYEFLPYTDLIQRYERLVDPYTGRPLGNSSRGTNPSCTSGFEGDCLPIRSNLSIGPTDPNPNTDGSLPAGVAVVDPSNRGNVLGEYGSNMQLFAMICATSIGFNAVDPTACGQSIFNSQRDLLTQQSVLPRDQAKTIGHVASGLANGLSGNGIGVGIVTVLAGAPAPLVPLSVDPCDSFFSDGDGTCASAIPARGPNVFYAAGGPTLNQVLTDEQEALVGCGPFWGTDCEADGIDLLNSDAGVLMQSFIGSEGFYSEAYQKSGFVGWTHANGLAQPGTRGFVQQGSGIPGGRYVNGRLVAIAGSRGPFDHVDQPKLAGNDPNVDRDGDGNPIDAGEYNINVDGDPTGIALPNAINAAFGDYSSSIGWANEMAALSFNLEMLLVAFSSKPNGAPDAGVTADRDEFNPLAPYSTELGQCSFLQAQYCSAIQSFFDITGAQRNVVRAGGNGAFGRRDFVWHSGAEALLRYTKRNVFGVSFDFAEDVTKSNWGGEFTWIEGQRFTDNDERHLITESDTLNLTVSVDRPTFINFLNQNRTFFFNSQVFFQYLTNYKDSFPGNGPFNMLGTFTVQTGYFQDRLLPGVTFVYDLRSSSGAALPSITYRFTENFSGQIGMNFFWGRFQLADMAIQPIGTIGNEHGKHAYRDGVENGLSVVRERDEVFMRLRYTF